MKKYTIIGLMLLGLSVASCDFLDTKPMDFGSADSYFKSPEDLKMSVNTFYEILPIMHASNNTGIHSIDNNSDNQVGVSNNDLFYEGDKRTPGQNNSQWQFKNLRGINYFINTVEGKIAKGELNGEDPLIKHYLGEGYFFRAFDYFRLLQNYGDVPIITEMLPDNYAKLIEFTKRAPRNEVARFILADLDKAITLLQRYPTETGRVARYAALTLKGRAALYEATWERYHAGTCFVPGNSKWQGSKMHPSFAFKAGSAEGEVNFFLDQAIAASDSVASNIELSKDYLGMFNNLKTFDNKSEVILARYYLAGVLTHNCVNYLARTGGGTGYTRALMNTFLTKNGLPIYAPGNREYLGDILPYLEMQNRDERMSMRGGGFIMNVNKIDTIHYFRPAITANGAESSTTGYHILKWISFVPGQDEGLKGTTATPIYRAAESYLIYLEAYYERNKSLNGKCETYWQALRTRAGVNPDFRKTIAATDLSKENDLATKSRNQYVDPTLYNIRRERRCEFIAEGMRLDDLKRWRALDHMKEYQPEGMNLWEPVDYGMWSMYGRDALKEGIVSQEGVSKYLHPLQKSATNIAYFGYTFPKQHYLEPIPISEILLATDKTTQVSSIYQNPGWPVLVDGTADYSFDCD